MDRSRLPLDYLERVSRDLTAENIGDCLVHARQLAELLRDAGREPHLAVIRKVEHGDPRGPFHVPLIPLRFPSRTWTTHYVCICDGMAYDPLIGEPVPVEGYTVRVFGKELSMVNAER